MIQKSILLGFLITHFEYTLRLIGRRKFLGLFTASLVSVTIPAAEGYFNTQKLQLTRLDLGIGGKAVLIVDTHLHSFEKIHEKLLEIIIDEEPDIIMLGGDLIDEYTPDIELLSGFLSSLDSKWKVAVLGNHEYWSGNASSVISLLRKKGFVVLKDSFIRTPFGRIYGVDWRDDRKYNSLVAEGIVLTHDPNAASGISGKCLILSGHTHGGVVIGGITLYSNSDYTRGAYKLRGGGTLYVSRGLGQIFPIRFTSPLELLIIE